MEKVGNKPKSRWTPWETVIYIVGNLVGIATFYACLESIMGTGVALLFVVIIYLASGTFTMSASQTLYCGLILSPWEYVPLGFFSPFLVLVICASRAYKNWEEKNSK